ncbi:hypothetical protein [uncultured Sulfitobacter sp.]|uniref:hypothetical protein n=1 Tax=uncultured Sulfitobacter sp. TaxID=191468 RepID=UPI00260D14C9|nr:hypothetical protein [uncultured Sulfitobacter sp.]
MRPLLYAVVLAVATPIAAQAQTYRAVNDLDVVPLSRSTFEVIEARGKGPRGIWCAAADYAERRLGAKGRIYIRDARGPSRSVVGRKSVVFTTNAANLSQGPFQSTSLNTSQVGVGLPIAHAIQFCRPDDFDITDRLLRRK